MVPTRALAETIAAEIREDPRRLAGKGIEDPAAAPNFRIAAGALDVIKGETGAREALVRDLAAYGDTDLVCFRAEGPDALSAREAEHWDPLCAWFGDRFGVTARGHAWRDGGAAGAGRARGPSMRCSPVSMISGWPRSRLRPVPPARW